MGDAMQAATFTAVGILVVLLCLFEPPWLPVADSTLTRTPTPRASGQ